MKAFFLSFIILISISAWSQKFSPQIDNYNIGDNQNWGVDVSEDDLIYVANNKGLLRFTGQQWKLMELPQKTIIRSVFVDENRIYTGSYEEFGFWERDLKGTFNYTSLNSLFNSIEEIGSEEFWQILKFQDKIVFRSFGGLYIYHEDSIRKVENSQGVSSIVNYQDQLLVATPNDGLQELVNGSLQPLAQPIAEKFQQMKSLASTKNKLFGYDESLGGFIYDGEGFSEIPNKLNAVLKKDVINKSAFINENLLAFGTIKNGILLYDFKTDSITEINKELGLNNNTVLGLDYHQGNLWVALDNGISKINLKSSYRYFFDLSGDLGTVYDIAFFQDSYYLASNTGIYTFKEGELELIQNSEGHVWNLSVIENQLFCGHNDGTYQIDGNQVIPVELSYGGVFGFTQVPTEEKIYLQGSYSGINNFSLKNPEPLVSKVEGINFPIKDIVFSSDQVIWATHPYKGLFRFTLNNEYSKIIKIEDFSDQSKLSQYKTEVFNIKNKVYFFNSNTWFEFCDNCETENFKEIKTLKGLRAVGVEEGGTWFLENNTSPSLLYLNNNFEEQLKLTDFELSRHLVANYEKVVIKNDSILMINLNDGFATFNKNNILNESSARPVIDKVYSPNSLFTIDSTSNFEVSYKDGNYLTFEVYTPSSFKNQMSYVLSGEANQHQPIKNGVFTLQNLDYGDYTLKIYNNYSADLSEKENSESKLITFQVLPPWYYSSVAFLIYAFVFLGLCYLIYLVNQSKIRKEQSLLKKKYTRETKEKIYELEKANLEKQIEDKKKELTKSARSVIKKNETIILLRNELNRLKEVSPNTNRTNKVLQSTKKNISSKDDWKQFEENFKTFNEGFFENLIKEFPKMSTRDLKLCAYIKTGLTSKEIAPLMGISKRGVELHRYRVRKKMQLDKNENFIDFLKKF